MDLDFAISVNYCSVEICVIALLIQWLTIQKSGKNEEKFSTSNFLGKWRSLECSSMFKNACLKTPACSFCFLPSFTYTHTTKYVILDPVTNSQNIHFSVLELKDWIGGQRSMMDVVMLLPGPQPMKVLFSQLLGVLSADSPWGGHFRFSEPPCS